MKQARANHSRFHRFLPIVPIALLVSAPVTAFEAEQAAYDSNGRITSLIGPGADFPLTTNIVAVLPNNKRLSLQVRRGAAGTVRHGDALDWSAAFTLPDGDRGHMELKSIEDASGVHYSAAVTADTDLTVSAIEFVVGVPRAAFVHGSAATTTGPPIQIGLEQPPGGLFFSGESSEVKFQDEGGARTLDVSFEGPRPVALADRWDADGRFLELRTAIRAGEWKSGNTASIAATLHFLDTTVAAPARLTIDSSKVQYQFQGFGGNYCWEISTSGGRGSRSS